MKMKLWNKWNNQLENLRDEKIRIISQTALLEEASQIFCDT